MSTQTRAPNLLKRFPEVHRGASHRGAGVRLTIRYCQTGNYGLPARRLARALERESMGRGIRLETELLAANGGIFEVSVDGRLIFSKKATSRLPDPPEIDYHIGAAISERAHGRSSGTAIARFQTTPHVLPPRSPRGDDPVLP